MYRISLPTEAIQASDIIMELLGGTAAGIYLYGSAVLGGLRAESDVDVMALVNRRLTQADRASLLKRLLDISGKVGNENAVRPLEVTVVNLSDVVPWRYPPRREFQYGEWLRAGFEKGEIPEPTYDPDLAILLSQIRYASMPLAGPPATALLAPVPMADIRSAMRDCLPDLMKSLQGDERNVILTLARMWVTAAAGEFLPKDKAAEWAMPRLPKAQAGLLGLAGKAYRGEYADRWEALGPEAIALANHMREEIELCLASPEAKPITRSSAPSPSASP